MRAYSLHEVGKLMHAAGFRVLEVSGGYQTRGRFFGNQSRHIIVLAERKETSAYVSAVIWQSASWNKPGLAGSFCRVARVAKTFGVLARLSYLVRTDAMAVACHRRSARSIAARADGSQESRSARYAAKRREARETSRRAEPTSSSTSDERRGRREEAARPDGARTCRCTSATWRCSTCCAPRRSSPPRARSRRSRSCCGKPCSRTRPRSSTSSTRSRACPTSRCPLEAQDAAHGVAEKPRCQGLRASASARAARKLRAADSDHLFIDAALGAIDRMTLGIGVRGERRRRRSARARRSPSGCAACSREPRRRRRAQRLRQGEPAPRRRRSRAASTTAAWRSPT